MFPLNRPVRGPCRSLLIRLTNHLTSSQVFGCRVALSSSGPCALAHWHWHARRRHAHGHSGYVQLEGSQRFVIVPDPLWTNRRPIYNFRQFFEINHRQVQTRRVSQHASLLSCDVQGFPTNAPISTSGNAFGFIRATLSPRGKMFMFWNILCAMRIWVWMPPRPGLEVVELACTQANGGDIRDLHSCTLDALQMVINLMLYSPAPPLRQRAYRAMQV